MVSTSVSSPTRSKEKYVIETPNLDSDTRCHGRGCLFFHMGRLLAIDYGRKRCGIAVTDPLRICANGLTTVRACDLMEFLKDYCKKEPVDRIIVGLPKQMDGTPSESTRYIEPFLKQLKKEMPGIPVDRYDERFTSTLAHRAMIDGGLRRMARRDKELVDEIAATIILNYYLSACHLP